MTPRDFESASTNDLVALREQLGRVPRGVLGIAARTPSGDPLVVVTVPRLPDGSPFPTLYYLTQPAATADISRLETSGLMSRMQDALATDPALAERYRKAHARYLADREAFGHVDEIAGISAGGMPDRVKCLHALAAHALAAGPGVNPLGDWALAAIGAASWLPVGRRSEGLSGSSGGSGVFCLPLTSRRSIDPGENA